MGERLLRVKEHLTEHRDKYLFGTVGIVVGSAFVYFSVKVNKDGIATITTPTNVTIDGDNNVVNVINNIIQNAGRNGHPGFVVVCHETNKIYRSIREAARDLDVNARTISEYFKGTVSDVSGYTFIKLGEAVANAE